MRVSNRVCATLLEGGTIAIGRVNDCYVAALKTPTHVYITPWLQTPANGVPLFHAWSERLVAAFVDEAYRSAARIVSDRLKNRPLPILGPSTPNRFLRNLSVSLGPGDDTSTATEQANHMLRDWYAVTPIWSGWIARVEIDTPALGACTLTSDEGCSFIVSSIDETSTISLSGVPELAIAS